MKYLIIPILTCLVSCSNNMDEENMPVSIPFTCEGYYSVRMSNNGVNASSFITSDKNNIYTTNYNRLNKIELASLKIAKTLTYNPDYRIGDMAVTKNYKIWLMQSPISSDEIFKSKISLVDTNGNIFFTKDFDIYTYYYKIIATDDNGCLVAINGFDSLSQEYQTKKHKFKFYRFNENGDILWTKEYQRQGRIDIIIENNNKEFIVCGGQFLEDAKYAETSGLLAKFDKNGNLIWERNQDFRMDYNTYSINGIIELSPDSYILSISFN